MSLQCACSSAAPGRKYSLSVGRAGIRQSTDASTYLAVRDGVALVVLLVAVDVIAGRIPPACELELCTGTHTQALSGCCLSEVLNHIHVAWIGRM